MWLLDPAVDRAGPFWNLGRRIAGLAPVHRHLQRFGLSPVRVITVPIDRLNALRSVRCEVVPESLAAPLDFLEMCFTRPDGTFDWRIRNSMHCSLYDTYLAGGLPERLDDLEYWQWHASLAKAGINARPPEWIHTKIGKAIALLESIRTRGFKDGCLANLPWVLEEPLIKTRYGIDHNIDGYEIYDGHHRVAAQCSLGHASTKAILVKDVATTTPFGILLEKVLIPAGAAEHRS